jgi:hypothetical protein
VRADLDHGPLERWELVEGWRLVCRCGWAVIDHDVERAERILDDHVRRSLE